MKYNSSDILKLLSLPLAPYWFYQYFLRDILVNGPFISTLFPATFYLLFSSITIITMSSLLPVKLHFAQMTIDRKVTFTCEIFHFKTIQPLWSLISVLLFEGQSLQVIY